MVLLIKSRWSVTAKKNSIYMSGYKYINFIIITICNLTSQIVAIEFRVFASALTSKWWCSAAFAWLMTVLFQVILDRITRRVSREFQSNVIRAISNCSLHSSSLLTMFGQYSQYEIETHVDDEDVIFDCRGHFPSFVTL